MCESTAFIRRGTREEKLLDDVVRVVIRGDTIDLFGILGHRVSVKAGIVDLDFMGHRLVLSERPARKPAAKKRRAKGTGPGKHRAG